MKVLHVLHRYWPAIGGSERYVQALSEYLTELGHEVTVWTTDALEVTALWRKGGRRVAVAEEVHQGVRVRRFPLRYLPGHPYAMRLLSGLGTRRGRFLYAPGTPRVPDMVREAERSTEHFDLVHVTPFPYDSVLYAGMRMAERRRAPLVVTPFVHLGEGPGCPVRKHYTRPHQLELLRSAAAVMVQTRKEHEFLADLWIPRERLHLVGVGIDPASLSGGDGARFRSKHGVEEPLAAHIGVRCRDKGTVDLLRAAEMLWAEGSPFRLALAGGSTPEFERELAAFSAEVRGRCLILGEATEEDKRDLLAAMELLALPSRTDSFGMVLLESWYYGKPVIAARAGALEEVVEEAKGGLLVPFGDPPALAAAMKRLLGEPRLRERLGQAGREKTLRTWTWDLVLPRIAEVYERVVAEKADSPKLNSR